MSGLDLSLRYAYKSPDSKNFSTNKVKVVVSKTNYQ